jgi:hypothetical protein
MTPEFSSPGPGVGRLLLSGDVAIGLGCGLLGRREIAFSGGAAVVPDAGEVAGRL